MNCAFGALSAALPRCLRLRRVACASGAWRRPAMHGEGAHWSSWETRRRSRRKNRRPRLQPGVSEHLSQCQPALAGDRDAVHERSVVFSVARYADSQYRRDSKPPAEAGGYGSYAGFACDLTEHVRVPAMIVQTPAGGAAVETTDNRQPTTSGEAVQTTRQSRRQRARGADNAAKPQTTRRSRRQRPEGAIP
jgi:hypothetical protein